MCGYHLIIDGHKVATEETFPVLNPATEEVLAQCPKATTQQLDQAVVAARWAFSSCNVTAESERTRPVHAIADAHGEELSKLRTHFSQGGSALPHRPQRPRARLKPGHHPFGG